MESGITLFFFAFQTKLWTLSLFWEKWRRLVSRPTTSTLLQFKWKKWLTSSLDVTSVRIPSCRNPFQIRSHQGMLQTSECVSQFFFKIVVICVFSFKQVLKLSLRSFGYDSQKPCYAAAPINPTEAHASVFPGNVLCHVAFVTLHSWLELKCFLWTFWQIMSILKNYAQGIDRKCISFHLVAFYSAKSLLFISGLSFKKYTDFCPELTHVTIAWSSNSLSLSIILDHSSKRP